MISVMYTNLVSGGPKMFMKRLLKYMQSHEMIKVVKSEGDIYLSTVWGGKKPKGCKHVHRAASVYYDTNQRRRHGLNKKIAKVVKGSDYVIFQTKFARQLHRKILGVSPKKFSIIHNGFDVSPYDAVEPSQLGNPNLFVACSNWSNPAKRLKFIVRSFRRADLDGHLVVIGPNAVKTKDSNISYVGAASMETIASYLKHRPVFVHLCYAESCPNVVVEALSFGCPVVCNNIGGTPEVVGEDGTIVQCDSKFIFKRRNVKIGIKDLTPVSKGLREAAGKKWFVSRSDLSMDSCSRSYLAVFERTLGE